jgi:hypothetical protein
MRIPRGGRSTRLRGQGRERRIRFKDAVPVRRDRRDLRRQFRRSARAAAAEREAEMTALLQRLSARRVPLAEITPGCGARDGIIEFLDGTQLLFATRRGGAAVKRLSRWHHESRAPVWLIRAQPSFTRRRFRLWFTLADCTKPAEIVAEVRPVPAGAFR